MGYLEKPRAVPSHSSQASSHCHGVFPYGEWNAGHPKYPSRDTRVEMPSFPDAVLLKGYSFWLSSSMANLLEETQVS